ncbi:MAG TPA: hypothetical protein VMV57_12970, partial [Terracidiphilus sp.]|nr:hypothetical protein [Terracidiphilus sp.]
FLFAIGWAGIFARRFYAAPHFLEPWPVVAESAADSVAQGGQVLTNSLPLLYDLNIALARRGLPADPLPGWTTNPAVFSLYHAPLPPNWARGQVLFVRGVNPIARQWTDEAYTWLLAHCRLQSTRNLLPDPAFQLKNRFFPGTLVSPYRITIDRFLCPASP